MRCRMAAVPCRNAHPLIPSRRRPKRWARSGTSLHDTVRTGTVHDSRGAGARFRALFHDPKTSALDRDSVSRRSTVLPKQSGGAAFIESEVGEGTSITLLLPRASSKHSPVAYFATNDAEQVGDAFSHPACRGRRRSCRSHRRAISVFKSCAYPTAEPPWRHSSVTPQSRWSCRTS